MHRILVVGTGSIGERHVRCMLKTKRAAVGICEINDPLRGEVAERYEIRESFVAVREAMKAQWDAAVIATPAHIHIPIALQLAGANVNLLIEKPLSTTTEGVESLMERVKKRGLVAAVAYVYRAHPALAAMKEALHSGRFGRPLQVVTTSGQNFPINRPAYREIYYADRATGGGAIQDAITHVLNACEWLLGPIDRLVADATHQLLEGVEVEDTVHLISRHGDVMGRHSLNQYQHADEMTITVVCSRGVLRFEMHEGRWRWKSGPLGDWQDQAVPQLDRDDWFTVQENAFLDALEGKTEPLCTLEQGLQTLKVNLAALRSADGALVWQTVE